MKSYKKTHSFSFITDFVGNFIARLLHWYPFIKGRSKITQIYGRRFQLTNGRVSRLFNGNKIELHPRQFVSQNIFLFGVFEPQEAKWFYRTVKTGMTIIDVGANIGQYTLLAADRVKDSGKVISFEPAQENFEILQRNVHLNKFDDRVKIIKSAVGSTIGTCEFVLTSDGGSNFISQNSSNGSMSKRVIVPCLTLDSFISCQNFEKIDLIKIDAEGADFEVIKGARKMLEKYHPILFVEFAERVLKKFETTPREMLNFLQQLGYEAHIFNRRGLTPLRNEDDISNCNICLFYNVRRSLPLQRSSEKSRFE